MAGAREGRGGAGSLEAELTCPICLGLYQEPVSMRCGHSFCRQCIKLVLEAQQRSQAPYTCPMCKLYVGPTVELQNNFELRNIVEAFQGTTSKGQQHKGSEKGEPGVVPCEYCLDSPQPAVKTCLVCNVSLCRAHLSKHNAKASQQEHVLVEVGAGEAEERRCQEHGKLLECYCRNDRKCICVLCTIAGAHKGHEVVTMQEERDKQLVKLSDTMTELKEWKRYLAIALEELQKSENQIKTNTRTVTSQLQELFENTKTQLAEKEKKILSAIQSKEKKQLADIAKVRKEMEQKTKQAERDLQTFQKIKEQPDVFTFLKEWKLFTHRSLWIGGAEVSTKRADVQAVQLDQSTITDYQTQGQSLMSQLDSVLEDVCAIFTNQMTIRNVSAFDLFSKAEKQQEE